MKRLILVLTATVLAVFAPPAQAVPAYADDAGSYMIQVGDRCAKWQEGQQTTGINPTTGNLVTIACQCNEVHVCFWVQISGYRAAMDAVPPNVEDDHTGGCVWVPPNVPWYCLIPIVWCDPSVFIGYWRC